MALSSLFREVFGVQQMRFKLLKREGYEGGEAADPPAGRVSWEEGPAASGRSPMVADSRIWIGSVVQDTERDGVTPADRTT